MRFRVWLFGGPHNDFRGAVWQMVQVMREAHRHFITELPQRIDELAERLREVERRL